VNPEFQEGEDCLYWESEDGLRSLRIVFDVSSKAVLGFNAFGIRLRHKVCDEWLRNSTPIDEVVLNLKRANFNPEFFKKFEKEVQLAFKSMSI
jgi:hypothetical protein